MYLQCDKTKVKPYRLSLQQVFYPLFLNFSSFRNAPITLHTITSLVLKFKFR